MRINRLDVVMLDPKGLVEEVDSETFKRHLGYSQLLGLENSQARLVILTSSMQDKQIIFESEFLLLINYFKPREYFVKRSRYSRREFESLGITPNLLVAGEPFETLLYTIIVSRRFESSVPIQLQLHFDPEQFRTGSGLYSKIKYLITLLAIVYCDSLRIVNEFQLNPIPKFVYKSKKISVAPLPLSKSATTGKVFKKDRPRNIGIFGRLHSERGIEEVLKAIAKLPRGFLDKVVIAGSGDLKSDFINGLNQLVGEKNVVYLGQLGPGNQQEFWDKVGVLISFPRFEAYGVSMRESLCRGIPVVSTKTIGSELLESDCPKEWLTILTDPQNPVEFKKSLETGFSIETNDSFKKHSIKSNQKNEVILVRSWLSAPEH